jgi:uncharacterized protein (DUF1330 family)
MDGSIARSSRMTRDPQSLAAGVDGLVRKRNAEVTNMPVPAEEEVNLVVLLWAYPGSSDRLVAYEDLVLEFLASHGGRLLHRLRTKGEGDAPLEIQVIRFPSEASYENYLTDQRRVDLRELRDTSVARTEVHRGYGVTIPS